MVLSLVSILALQLYLSFTALVFAVWNVGASRAAGARGEPQALVYSVLVN